MAITYGTPTVANDDTGAATSLTINKPATLADNDVLVALVAMNCSTTNTVDSWTLDSGWVQSSANNDGQSDPVHFSVFYKVITNASSEPASYTFTMNGTASQSGDMAGGIVAATGVDNTTPISTVGTQSGTTSTTLSFGSVTASNVDEHYIGVGGMLRDPSFTFNDGMTELIDHNSNNATVSLRIAVCLGYVAVGTTGVIPTKTATASQSRPHEEVAFLLNPVVDPPTVTTTTVAVAASVGSVAVKRLVAALPNADISNPGLWINELGGSVLYTSIDEPTLDVADYAESPVNPSNATFEVALEDIADPFSSIDHYIEANVEKLGSGTVDVTLALYQGAVLIASGTQQISTTGVQVVRVNLSGTEADAITDYSDLRLRITANEVV